MTAYLNNGLDEDKAKQYNTCYYYYNCIKSDREYKLVCYSIIINSSFEALMRKKSQVFTPTEYVEELLNQIDYHHNLYGKKVMDNACGTGNILISVVKRYIYDALQNKISLIDIKKGLEEDIYGCEIDEEHYNKCLTNLNDIAEKFGITDIKWKIKNQDSLKTEYYNIFDYVIGNPPYISHRELDLETREFIFDKFETCKHGKFDYCYAFIEMSILSLKSDTGKLAYLVPSSIFKNVFAQKLRDYLLPYTTKIVDFTTNKLFDNALTSSAFLLCSTGHQINNIQYQDVAHSTTRSISKKVMADKWIFTSYRNISKNKRFGDYFHAASSIATLRNNIFVLKDCIEDEDFFIYRNHKFEKQIIKKAVSPRSQRYGTNEYIIFPYQYENGVLRRYTENEFITNFPETVKYLDGVKDKLRERKSDNSACWFEYGRSQALSHINHPKLLISTVITHKACVYSLSEEEIPYSGIYICSKQDIALDKAKDILESDDFYSYVQSIGIYASGSSLRITSADINNYMFE